MVYIYGSNGQVAGVPVDTDHASSGTTYKHAMPGTFYLNIKTVASSYMVEGRVQQ